MIIIDKTDIRKAKQMGETYGWLFRGGVNNAGKRLSYESFKWYVDLALNQDGYHCKDQIPDDVADELYKYGYLAFSRGETHFNEWGNDETVSNPEQYQLPAQNVQATYSPKYPHSEPTASYEDQGYSDTFVHVGADGHIQDEPETEPEITDLDRIKHMSLRERDVVEACIKHFDMSDWDIHEAIRVDEREVTGIRYKYADLIEREYQRRVDTGEIVKPEFMEFYDDDLPF